MTSSISSMGSYMSQMNAHAMHQRRDDLFNKIDSDGSGGLDKAEFSDFAKKLSEQSGNSLNVEDIFSTYDADGDGALSKTEMDSFIKESAPTPPVDMQNAMSAYGMNIQAMQHREEMFNKMDSNGDGGIDQTEFEAIASKMSERTGNSINVEDIFPHTMQMATAH